MGSNKVSQISFYFGYVLHATHALFLYQSESFDSFTSLGPAFCSGNFFSGTNFRPHGITFSDQPRNLFLRSRNDSRWKSYPVFGPKSTYTHTKQKSKYWLLEIVLDKGSRREQIKDAWWACPKIFLPLLDLHLFDHVHCGASDSL